MSSLKYIALNGSEIDLLCNTATVQTAKGLRGYEYKYELGYNSAYSVRNDAREIALEVAVMDMDEAQRMASLFDYDVRAHMENPSVYPSLQFGNASTYALVVGSAPKEIYPNIVVLELTVVLPIPVWRDATNTVDYMASTNPEIVGAIDFPFDFSHDLGYEVGAGQKVVQNNSLVPCDFLMVISGACDNPEITIGSNTYQVMTSVPAGGRLEIDSVNKTIRQYSASSVMTDVFALGVRGSGRGSGQYIFEKIKPGASHLSWNRTFNFRLTVYEETLQPRWNQ